jgi:GH15 family glucan-1,4-alpha-glucosidase
VRVRRLGERPLGHPRRGDLGGPGRPPAVEDFWDDRRGTFVQHLGSTTLDASVLLMPIAGFISPQDPRWVSTLKAVDQELVEDALVYRYTR